MIELLAVLAAAGPAAAWLWFFYHRDRYEREPRRLIIGLFARGALIATPIAFVVNTVVGLFGVPILALAGFTEEPIKLGTAAQRTRRDRNLDEPIDGMIYGTSVGLGFAAAETTYYILAEYFGFGSTSLAEELRLDPFTASFLVLAPLRAIASASGHAMWSGIAGYYFGQQVLRGGKVTSLIGPLLGVAVLHSLYNALGLIGIVVILPVSAIVYARLVRRALAESPHRRDELHLPPAIAGKAVDPAFTGPQDRRPCPHCGESIAAQARYCRFCRRQVGEADADSAAPATER